MKKLFISFFSLFLLSLFLFLPETFAVQTSSQVPTADGNYVQWVPKTGTSHYQMVDETTCNGTTDYNSTNTLNLRDSYVVSLSSVPNYAIITGISITPCASRAKSGGGTSTMNVFYRLDGVDSADAGSYSLSGTTPTSLTATTYSGLSVTKLSTTTFEIGAVYSAGTKGVRLSKIAVVITYNNPPAPTVTTNDATNVQSNSATLNSTVNPNGNSTTVWYRYGTTNTSCNLLPSATTTLSIGNGLIDVSPNSKNIASLSASTTYYFCAAASNVGGTTYGNVLSFTTLP